MLQRVERYCICIDWTNYMLHTLVFAKYAYNFFMYFHIIYEDFPYISCSKL